MTNSQTLNKEQDNILANIIKDLTWWQAISLSMYINGKKNIYDIEDDLIRQPTIKKCSTFKKSKSVYHTVQGQLQLHTGRDSKTVKCNKDNRNNPALFDKNENKKWYLTQDGIKYIEKNMTEYIEKLGKIFNVEIDEQCLENDYFAEEILPTDKVFEGAVKQILVNKYERSNIARKKCIELNGVTCAICGFNFEKVYGEIGKNYIHIHHKIPISEIKKEYIIDYKNDLLPVCPNCHAMLHKKINGENISIEELKRQVLNIKNNNTAF